MAYFTLSFPFTGVCFGRMTEEDYSNEHFLVEERSCDLEDERELFAQIDIPKWRLPGIEPRIKPWKLRGLRVGLHSGYVLHPRDEEPILYSAVEQLRLLESRCPSNQADLEQIVGHLKPGRLVIFIHS